MAVVRTGTGGGVGPRAALRARVCTVLAATLLPAAFVAGCSGDDDKTLPAIDQSSSPGVDDQPSESAGRPSRTDRSGGSETAPAPAPKGADLAPDEEAAYDKAVADQTDWAQAATELQANPVVNATTRSLVHKWAFDPYASSFLDRLDSFVANDIRTTGRTELHWRVPVRVDLDARWPVVVWKECHGDGTLEIFKNGEEVQQEDRTPFASELTLRADASGRWRPIDVKDLGSCGA